MPPRHMVNDPNKKENKGDSRSLCRCKMFPLFFFFDGSVYELATSANAECRIVHSTCLSQINNFIRPGPCNPAYQFQFQIQPSRPENHVEAVLAASAHQIGVSALPHAVASSEYQPVDSAFSCSVVQRQRASSCRQGLRSVRPLHFVAV